MKKSLIVLLVLAFCIPAMAATVVVTDNGDATATVVVTAEGTENIVGLGLDIDRVSGGNIIGATVDTALFNIHMDAAYDDAGAYVYGTGTAIADQNAAGEVAVSNSFAISVGALNGAATPGADGAASVSITITVDADTNFNVKENSLRGGIVLTTGAGEDITNGTSGVVNGDATEPAAGCRSMLTAAEQIEFDKYEVAQGAGAADSWCWAYQCRGDAGHDTEGFFKLRVFTSDLNILVANWKAKIATAPAAADFAHDGEGFFKLRVFTNDLNILVANWKAKDVDLTVCPSSME